MSERHPGNGSALLELRAEQGQLRKDLTAVQADIRSVLERVAHSTHNTGLIVSDILRQLGEVVARVQVLETLSNRTMRSVERLEIEIRHNHEALVAAIKRAAPRRTK